MKGSGKGEQAAREGGNSEEENHTAEGSLKEGKGSLDVEDWPAEVGAPLKKFRLWENALSL